MAFTECLLCSKQLTNHSHPETAHVARMYSETLIRLFKFPVHDASQYPYHNVNSCSEAPGNASNNHFDYRNETNENTDYIANLEKCLLQVSYCLNCVQRIRNSNVIFRDADKIRQQILEYRRQIIDILVGYCGDIDITHELVSENDNKPLISTSARAVRNDIIQGFSLSTRNTTTSSGNSNEVCPIERTGRPIVQLSRLEEMPEILAQHEKVILKYQLRNPSRSVKNEPVVIDKEEGLTDSGSANDYFLTFEDSPQPQEFENHLTEEPNFSSPMNQDCKSVSIPAKPNTAKSSKKRVKSVRRTTKLSSKKSSARLSVKRTFPCNYEGCNFVANTWNDTVHHKKDVHKLEELGQDYPCNLCGKKFVRPDLLKLHEKRMHPNKNALTCTECSTVYSSSTELRKHQKEVHKTGFGCHMCSFICRLKYNLKEHIQLVHHKERNFICQHCGLDFTTSQRLKYHQGAKHPELNLVPNPEKYKCGQCDKILCDPYSLKNHIKTVHLKEFKLRCEICGQGLQDQSKLKNHMIGHTGERNFECQICHAKFLRSGYLARHMQRHTGDFKHKCKVCSKNFISRGPLVRHEQIHEGVLRHICPTCNKGFPVRNYLYIHMRSHETPEEREERRKRSQEGNLPPLAKLYHELRKKKSTVVSTNPDVEQYQMIYDYERERNTISRVISDQPAESRANTEI